ncbi:MAG: hydantoinase B/oxoprolinase family protein [Gammaproteobacteria bacterium]|nr:hydantoinase B/oxoprolinase family protein [Gammaproteobacteria bacterium]
MSVVRKTGYENPDIFTMEIIKDSIVALGDEMFNAMIRTSMSPIIYETTDFAVGATDAKGNLLAQGNGVAGFLVTLDTAVQSLFDHYALDEICDGDVFITNSPYEGGGTHLSDVVILVPIFFEDQLIAWTVNKAHWTEVGGAQPGSISTSATDIYQEGLHFRFLKLYEQGRLVRSLHDLIRDNVRLPESTLGDMHAGVAAAKVGAKRILDLVSKYGCTSILLAMDELLDYGEEMTRVELEKLPQGEFEAEDLIESDGLGNGPFHIRVKVTIAEGRMLMDFSGTAAQAPGPINVSSSGLVTATRCVFKCITNPEIPANGGCFRALDIVCPQGTLFSAVKPAPVSLYYETDVAAMELVWKALAPALKNRLPAGHYRSVSGTFISGQHLDTNDLFVMGEPLAGGWGASYDRDGDSGQFSALNGETFNIPVELFETRYGIQVEQYSLHNADGGGGEYLGGKGVVIDYRVTAETAYLTYGATRGESRPWGMEGGQNGSHNYALVIREDGKEERYNMCTTVPVKRGELIRIFTGTGGGYGDPLKRPRQQVSMDLKNGYITTEQANQQFNLGV